MFVCIGTEKEYKLEYRKKYKKEISQYQKTHREENIDKAREISRRSSAKYREVHKDKVLENIEQVREQWRKSTAKYRAKKKLNLTLVAERNGSGVKVEEETVDEKTVDF